MKTTQNKAEQDTITIAELEEKDESCSTKPRRPKRKLKIHIDTTEASVTWTTSPPPPFFWFPGNTF